MEHLQELGQESTYLALWLDCDREGENIGFEVISLVSEWVPYDCVYRANFSALTQTELTHAYNNLGHPDKYQAMSVDARQELDLKIGVGLLEKSIKTIFWKGIFGIVCFPHQVAFSRLMTRTYLDMAREKFRLKDQKVISYGPCQTPTLWFCVQVVIVITLDIIIVVVIDVMTVMSLSLML